MLHVSSGSFGKQMRSRCRLVLAVVLALVCARTGSAGENPYTNSSGVMGGAIGSARRGSLSVNPGNVGQLLLGAYYDVRPVVRPPGIGETQTTTLRIVNTSLEAGMLFRLRFRESKSGLLTLNIYGFVGCGETWSATVLARSDGVPAVRSKSQTLAAVTAATFTSTAGIDVPTGAPFLLPVGVSVEDMQRGSFEVIGTERIECGPTGPRATLNNWNRLGTGLLDEARTPLNALTGDVQLRRDPGGLTVAYTMTALSRFLVEEGGSVFAPPGQTGLPGLIDCVIPSGTSGLASGNTPCVRQANFALAKSRLVVPFDVSSATAARTLLIVNLPTQHEQCVAGGTGPPNPPFQCDGRETIGVRARDEDGHKRKWASLNLPRATSVISVGDADPLADKRVAVAKYERGWLDVALASDPVSQQTHGQTELDPDETNLLGAGFSGYQGLPAIALVLQEYDAGGTERATLSVPPHEVAIDP